MLGGGAMPRNGGGEALIDRKRRRPAECRAKKRRIDLQRAAQAVDGGAFAGHRRKTRQNGNRNRQSALRPVQAPAQAAHEISR